MRRAVQKNKIKKTLSKLEVFCMVNYFKLTDSWETMQNAKGDLNIRVVLYIQSTSKKQGN